MIRSNTSVSTTTRMITSLQPQLTKKKKFRDCWADDRWWSTATKLSLCFRCVCAGNGIREGGEEDGWDTGRADGVVLGFLDEEVRGGEGAEPERFNCFIL